MKLETARLIITDFTPDMARDVHLGSLDADMQRFLPDEVFPTEAVAAEVISELISCYDTPEGPYVHPCLLHSGEYAGYVQLISLGDGAWEVGYHIAGQHTRKGYATEALTAFLPVMMSRLGLQEVSGICDAENAASIRVLEKCGFVRVYEGMGMYHGRPWPIVRFTYRK
ncbi:MAG: GNAT family N-acetyltransferase [Clostridia bacterium]|nr:GNAT family N-acetyltransferase [Clostridia bacterium]